MKYALLKALAKKKIYFKKKPKSDKSDDSLTSDDEEEVSKDMLYTIYNNRYIVIKYLGRGTFCRTWLCYDLINNQCVALKLFFSEFYDDSKNELKIHSLLKSKSNNIVHLLDNFTIEKKQNCLIYELMGLTLIDVVDYYNDKIPLNILKIIIKQIAEGLNHLHSNNIIHADLKLENIMISQLPPKIATINDSLLSLNLNSKLNSIIEDNLPENYGEFPKHKKKNVKRKIKQKSIKQLLELIKTHINSLNIKDELKIDETNLNCKLIDLGNSEILGESNDDEIMLRCYRPPENIMNNYYNEKADIWAFGCICYELFTHYSLFDIDNELSEIDKNRNHLHQLFEIFGKIPKEYTLNCDFSEELFDEQGHIIKYKHCDYGSLEKLLIKDEINELLAKEISNFLSPFFNYNVNERINANEILNHSWLN